MSSQEEHKRILKMAEEDVKAAQEAARIFDWDANFDYSIYPEYEIEKSKGRKGYHFYINESKIWKDKRLIRIMIDGFRCRLCGRQDVTLSVDHCWASYPKTPHESIHFDLTTLCWGIGSCHAAQTNVEHERLNQKYDALVVEAHSDNSRKGIERHGRSKKVELQAHRGMPHHFSQRSTSEPTE